jgi:hypothetical protein
MPSTQFYFSDPNGHSVEFIALHNDPPDARLRSGDIRIDDIPLPQQLLHKPPTDESSRVGHSDMHEACSQCDSISSTTPLPCLQCVVTPDRLARYFSCLKRVSTAQFGAIQHAVRRA